MSEVILAFLTGEFLQDLADPVPQTSDGPFFGFSEQGLQFGEYHLDRVEIRRVRGEIFQGRASGLDCLFHSGHFMNREIVHDNHVARQQGWRENPPDTPDILMLSTSAALFRPLRKVRATLQVQALSVRF